MIMHFISEKSPGNVSRCLLRISGNLSKAVLVETAVLRDPLSYQGKTSQKHLLCRCRKYNLNNYMVKTVFP
jgi:hypothetical protein